ncbi:MAG: glycosyltransferase family 2 protein [Desulfobulbaceae bacterium]|jgi:glycosyltransferase involved in cell wall biosynthesis|nr:glycosyltransferase family 2 protein [Desulfobulbaceae bacterium]
MKTLAVIPAFNERKNIAQVVAGVRKYISTVLVVDDASLDDTAQEAISAGAIVVRHPYNLGYAAACQTGYKYALADNYERVVQLDGDGQHDVEDIPKLLSELDHGANMVIGSRFSGVGDYSMQKMRHIGKNFFSLLIRLSTKQEVRDPTSGYLAFSKPVLELFVSDMFADEYPDADMLILAMRHGHKVVETGVSMQHSNTGQSMHAGLIGPAYYMLRMSIGVLTAIMTDTRKE